MFLDFIDSIIEEIHGVGMFGESLCILYSWYQCIGTRYFESQKRKLIKSKINYFIVVIYILIENNNFVE